MDDPSDSAIDDDPEADKVDGNEPLAPDVKDSAVSPALPDGTIWGEVCAVLAIGVVPHILFAGVSLRLPPALPPPYWLDAVQAIVMSGCTIFVTLYLIHRSGKSWEGFGLPRPILWDLPLGLAVLLVEVPIWYLPGLLSLVNGATSDYQYPHFELRTDHVLMVLKFGISAFAEELVTRAYLITRFEYLLRSKGMAVVVSALLFASYHGYQGLAGLISAMVIGLVYGAVFLWLRRVWPLVIAHTLFNIWWEIGASSQNW